MIRKIFIVGAGAHGRSAAEAALAGGRYSVAGFLDDAFPALEAVWGIPVLGKIGDFERWRGVADCAIVAIDINVVRQQITVGMLGAGFEIATVVHPVAIVSPGAAIGAGSAIMVGATIGTEAQLGNGVIATCAAVVDHRCRVGAYGHLGVNAAIAGGSSLRAFAWMQAGSAVGYGAEIPEGRVLSAGEAENR